MLQTLGQPLPQSSLLQPHRIPRLMELSIKKPRFTNSCIFCHMLHGCIFWKIAVQCVFPTIVQQFGLQSMFLILLHIHIHIHQISPKLLSSLIVGHFSWPIGKEGYVGHFRKSADWKVPLRAHHPTANGCTEVALFFFCIQATAVSAPTFETHSSSPPLHCVLVKIHCSAHRQLLRRPWPVYRGGVPVLMAFDAGTDRPLRRKTSARSPSWFFYSYFQSSSSPNRSEPMFGFISILRPKWGKKGNWLQVTWARCAERGEMG